MHYSFVSQQDPEVFEALEGEERRQAEGLELIPSENYVSRAVREALGSAFTNKYSEGLPGKRYYGGQEFTDQVEEIARTRACRLFAAAYANVQPLSGAPANLAVYHAVLQPGDTVMGMDLSHGGHLTHGHPLTVAAQLFRFVTYKMKNPETGEIDYEAMRMAARREKPKLIIAGFSAYTRELDYAAFADIAREVGALAMADIAHTAGLIAGGVLANPFSHSFDLITTTTHKTLRGPRGGMILVREENEELITRINRAVFPGLQGGPHMNVIAAKAVAFGEALHSSFGDYCTAVLRNAKAMAAVFAREGVRMLGGGTDNHLLLLDVYGSFGVGGKEAEEVLDAVGITLNKNTIADDPRPPLDPSGVRLGTPAITTRGMGEVECARVAEIIVEALRARDDRAKKKALRDEVRELAAAFPVPEKFV